MKKNEMKLSLRIIPVNKEADWEKYMPILDIFDDDTAAAANPLTTCQLQYAWWQSDMKSRFPVYLLIISATETPSVILAYSFFSVSQDKNRFLKPFTLKAFNDLFFMNNVFFNRKKQMSADSLQKFLSKPRIKKQIHRQTGADLIIWQPLPPEEYKEQPKKRSTPWFVKKSTDYPSITMPQDFSYFERPEVMHAVKDIRKQTKRIVGKFKVSPSFSCYHIDSDTAQSYSFENTLARFSDLRKKTWQYKWEEESTLVNTEILTAKIALYSSVWSKKGSLYLYFMTIDGHDTAYLYTLQTDTICWCLMIGYDETYKTYSPGKQIFHNMLQETHRKGIVKYHLGGSVVGWKSDWFTHNYPLYSIELWLSSPKALIHRVVKTFVFH